MMNMGLSAMTLCFSVTSFAATFSVTDPHGQIPCAPGIHTGCDVVGTPSQSDLKTGFFNFGPTSGTILIYMDYGPAGAPNLAPFVAAGGVTLSIADLFFTGEGGTVYAIPLFNRTTGSFGSATAGTVYQANSPAALLNSEVVLNNPPGFDFRSGYPVWINTNQATVASIGSVGISSGAAEGTTWLVTVNFSYGAGSQLANDLNAPGLEFFTGTTTGASDLADNTETPEPSSWVMLSIAGVGLLAGRRLRR